MEARRAGIIDVFTKVASAVNTAVIVKGNPRWVKGNREADLFYDEIGNYLKSRGVRVSFDPGLAYTSPRPADLWIGHSRGGDRMAFAPKTTKTLVFGSPAPGAINHAQDRPRVGVRPGRFHYVFTRDMKSAIDSVLGR